MSFLSNGQIEISVRRLSDLHVFFGFAFLALKKARLPVGELSDFSYSVVDDLVLKPYFDPLPGSGKFFNPFASSHPENPWVGQRYSSTSLQRVMADTFGAAFLHQKRSSYWGFVPGYVEVLSVLMRTTKSSPIPVLDLAVWLYRNRHLPDVDDPAQTLMRWFGEEFNFTPEEYHLLCSGLGEIRSIELAASPYSDSEFLNVFGWPEGSSPTTGLTVDQLRLRNVGPVRRVEYEPSSRLNVIVGDNSVGKTFLLESLWWSLTRRWPGYSAEPRGRNYKQTAEIRAVLADRYGRRQNLLSLYDPGSADWSGPPVAGDGFGIYARFDGSIAVWDTLRAQSPLWRGVSDVIVYAKKEIWDGKAANTETHRPIYISDGLIRDIVNWQRDESKSVYRRAFGAALKILAKGTEIRGLGRPTKVPGDNREIPTVRMPYGDVPVVFASAGTQRALSIAYITTLSWLEHLDSARRIKREPLSSIVVVLDELEAHLHPKWQRTVLPSIMVLIEQLFGTPNAQIHVATHSPLVLASIEPASTENDSLHHLELNGGIVELERAPFPRLGTVDAWLTSDVFELAAPRSLDAQLAIERAEELLFEEESVDAGLVRLADAALRRSLPDDDDFWIRWNFFKKSIDAQS